MVDNLEYIKRIKSRFYSPDDALFRLDSIDHIAKNMDGKSENESRKYLKDAVRVGLCFSGNEQAEALKIIERKYNEALSKSNSNLRLGKRRIDLTLWRRVKEYLTNTEVIPKLKTLERIFEEELIEDSGINGDTSYLSEGRRTFGQRVKIKR